MSYEVTDPRTGKVIYFKYRDVGVGGQPFVDIGEHRLPAIEFIGLAVSYLRQLAEDDASVCNWVLRIEQLRFEATRSGQLRLRLPAPIAGTDGIRDRPHSNVIPMAGMSTLGIGGFSYRDVVVSRCDFLALLEYFLSNYFFDDLSDARLELVRSLAPALDLDRRWSDTVRPSATPSAGLVARLAAMFRS